MTPREYSRYLFTDKNVLEAFGRNPEWKEEKGSVSKFQKAIERLSPELGIEGLNWLFMNTVGHYETSKPFTIRELTKIIRRFYSERERLSINEMKLYHFRTPTGAQSQINGCERGMVVSVNLGDLKGAELNTARRTLDIYDLFDRGTLKYDPETIFAAYTSAMNVKNFRQLPRELEAWGVRMLRFALHWSQNRYDFSSFSALRESVIRAKIESPEDPEIQQDSGLLLKVCHSEMFHEKVRGKSFLELNPSEFMDNVESTLKHINDYDDPEFLSVKTKGRGYFDIMNDIEGSEAIIKARGRPLAEAEGTKIMAFEDGSAWFDLGVSGSRKEGRSMGHCGNGSHDPESNETLLSLRFPVGKRWRPVATFVYNKEERILGEMKGVDNEKPDAEYHDKIIELLLQEALPIKELWGGSYKPENDFSLNDLSDEHLRYVADKKMSLLTPELVYRLDEPELMNKYLKSFFDRNGFRIKGRGDEALIEPFDTESSVGVLPFGQALGLNCMLQLYRAGVLNYNVLKDNKDLLELVNKRVRESLGQIGLDAWVYVEGGGEGGGDALIRVAPTVKCFKEFCSMSLSGKSSGGLQNCLRGVSLLIKASELAEHTGTELKCFDKSELESLVLQHCSASYKRKIKKEIDEAERDLREWGYDEEPA